MQELRDSYRFQNYITVSRVFTEPQSNSEPPANKKQKKQKVSTSMRVLFNIALARLCKPNRCPLLLAELPSYLDNPEVCHKSYLINCLSWNFGA